MNKEHPSPDGLSGGRQTAAGEGWQLNDKYLIRFSLLATQLLALTVIAGWFIRSSLLVRMLPGGPPMLLDSAVCFWLFSVGFLLAQNRTWRASSLIGGLLTAWAVIHLLLVNTSVSVHWLLPSLTRAILARPEQLDARMSPAMCVVILLLGLTLGFAPNQRNQWGAGWLALVAGFAVGSIGLFALVGLIDGIDYRQFLHGFLERMSAPEAVASCASGFSLCIYFLSHSQLKRAEWPLATAVLGAIALVLLFAGIKRSEFVSTAAANRARADLALTYRRLNSLNRLVDAVQKAETGERGFLLTKDESYLKIYESGVAEVGAQVKGPADEACSPRLRSLIALRLVELERIVKLARSGDSLEALRLIRTGEGFAVMDQIDREAQSLIQKLEQEGVLRAESSEKSVALVNRMLVSSFIIAALLVGLATFLVAREIRRRARTEEELLQNESVLEARVVARTREVVNKAAELRRSMMRREKAEKQLLEMQERLTTGLATSEVAVWTWNVQEGGFLAWTGPVERIFGLGPGRLNSYPSLLGLIVAEDRELVNQRLQASMEQGSPFAAEFRITKPGNGIRWIAARGGVLLDSAGRVVRMAGVNYDITVGKLAEQRLAESETRFRELANAMPQIVWTAAADGTFDFYNDRWHQLMGSPQSGTGGSLEDRRALLHPEDYERWRHAWASAIETGTPYEGEFRLWDSTREEFRWHLSRAVPVKDEKGAVARWFGTATDIHEHKRAANLLVERDRQLALIFDHGGIGSFSWGSNGELVSADPAMWKLYGAQEDPGGAPASWFRERQHPEDREMIDREIQKMLETGRPMDVEFRVVWPDGSVHWLAGWAAVRTDMHGIPVAVSGVNADITARKEAEMELREREEHFRTLCNAIPQIVWMAGADGRFDFYNDRWYEFAGSTREDGADESWKPILYPDDVENWAEGWQDSVRSGRQYERELRFWDRKRGEYRWYLCRALPLHGHDGKVARWLGTCGDIHEQKTAQERLEMEVLRQTEELRRSLEEKETLLKEVHHRVKNNLQIISSLLRMQSDALKDQGAAAALKDSQRRVLSMALIHEKLYGSRQMEAIDFSEYVRILVNELCYSYARRSVLVTSRLEISQVFLNIDQAIPCGLILNELVTNALKYAYPDGGGGELTVELRHTAADRVLLTVSDNGVGLPANFSWRDSKSLGLPIVEVLVSQLGGTLTVGRDGGASFAVEFPKETTKSATAA